MSEQIPDEFADKPRLEFDVECDCGTIVHVVYVLEAGKIRSYPREIAATCDCGRTKWITLTPVGLDQTGGEA